MKHELFGPGGGAAQPGYTPCLGTTPVPSTQKHPQIAKYLFFGLTERVNTNVDCKIFALWLNAT